MKLLFDNLAFGRGTPFTISPKIQGLNGNLDTTKIKLPRSDYSRHISSYLGDKMRLFSGWLIADDLADVRGVRRDLINRLRQDYNFTLIDDYLDNNNVVQTYATYTFTGRIEDVQCDESKWVQNKVPWSILISCEDPYLYKSSGLEETCSIKPKGFTFPMIFPFVFSGRDNVIVVDNDGGVPVYPVITIHGALNNLTIKHENALTSNKLFTYTGSLSGSDELIITPTPTDPIKVRKNGVSAIANTNFNFESLAMPVGENTFTFFLEGNEDSNTLATLAFYPAFIGI